MKLLAITEEIEKSIVTLFDVALKAGGASVLSHIDAIRNAVQLPIAKPPLAAPTISPEITSSQTSTVES